MGWIGTDIFLALAGFLCVAPLREAGGGLLPFAKHVGHRFARVALPYYAFIALYLHTDSLFTDLIAGGHNSHIADGFEFSLWTFTCNALLARGHWSDVALEGLFALSLGVQVFLFIGCMLSFLRRDQHVLIGLLALLLLSNGLRILGTHSTDWSVYFGTLTRLDAFVAGAALALAYRNTRWRTKLVSHAHYILALSALILVAVIGFTRGLQIFSPVTQGWGHPAIAFFAVSLVLYSTRHPTVLPPLRGLARLGKLAFPTYLVKLPSLYVITRVVVDAGWAHGWQGLLFAIGAGLLGCFILGGVFWAGVERPLQLATSQVMSRMVRSNRR